MSLSDVLSELEQLLHQERLDIRSGAATAVLAAAARKEELFERIKADRGDLANHRERFVALTSELRRNGVLLAHARDCTRDALALIASGGGGGNVGVGRFLNAKG